MHVVHNRVNHIEFANDYCEVITEPWAFTWLWQQNLGTDNPTIWADHIYKTYTTERDTWSLILLESIKFYVYDRFQNDPTEGSICYMTFLEYLRRDFQPHCPFTEYHSGMDNHVFFTPI